MLASGPRQDGVCQTDWEDGSGQTSRAALICHRSAARTPDRVIATGEAGALLCDRGATHATCDEECTAGRSSWGAVRTCAGTGKSVYQPMERRGLRERRGSDRLSERWRLVRGCGSRSRGHGDQYRYLTRVFWQPRRKLRHRPHGRLHHRSDLRHQRWA